MKLIGSTKSKITQNKNDENVPRLEITEVVLIHYNVVNNSYQQNSRVLYTFVPNKWFCQLLNISPKTFMFLKTFDSENIDAWFTNQNCKLVEIEDKTIITLVINQSIKMTRYSVQPRNRFLSFAKNMCKNIGKITSKSLNNKYSRKLIDHAKQSARDVVKICSKIVIQKNSGSDW